MTTIVKHRRTGNEYILLGINGEANKANPSRFISELFNQEKSEVSCSATVCDVQGNLFIANIDDLIVVEIDGVKPAEILPEVNYEDEDDNDDNDDLRSRTVEEVQSPSADFDEEDFEDEEKENFASTPPKPVVVEVVDSLDAPNRDLENEDEDWI